MKRLASVCALSALVLLGCSSSNDQPSNTNGGSFGVFPGEDLVITQEQAATLIGKTEAKAEAFAHDNGWVWRVGRRDGEQFMLTQDYCECRVTVSIDNSVVTEAVVG